MASTAISWSVVDKVSCEGRQARRSSLEAYAESTLAEERARLGERTKCRACRVGKRQIKKSISALHACTMFCEWR